MQKPRDRNPPPPDRTFRRLQERDAPRAPLPVAWSTGLALGLLAGLVAMAADVAALERARIPVLPALDLASVGPWLAAHAALGAALGLLGGSTGLVGPRWATASVITALGWLGAPAVIETLGPRGVPGAAALGGSVLSAAALGQAAGRVPLPAWLHAGAATLSFAALAALAPIHGHLLSSSTAPGALVASAAVVAVFAPIAAMVAVFARDGRSPVGALAALGSVAFGGAVAARAPAAPPPPPGPPGPTLVLVALDGVGAADLERVPALARMARRSVWFEHAFSTSDWPVPALGSALTGRRPYHHLAGLNDGRGPTGAPIDPRIPTIVGSLRARGYATIGVTSDPGLRGAGLDAGFQVWEDTPAGGAGPVAAAPLAAAGLLPAGHSAAVPAALVTERAAAHLRDRAGTAALLLAHVAAPVGDPSGAAGLDASLGALFDAVPSDAWLVVFGTHGPAIADPVAPPDGEAWFRRFVSVPLLVRGPRVPPRRVERPVTLSDVAATLAVIAADGPAGAAIEAPDGAVLAEVFGAEADDGFRPVLAESSGRGPEQRAIVDGGWLLVERDGASTLASLAPDATPGGSLGLPRDDVQRRLEQALGPVGRPAGGGDLPPLPAQLAPIVERILGSGR